jgi:hypothetical protein
MIDRSRFINDGVYIPFSPKAKFNTQNPTHSVFNSSIQDSQFCTVAKATVTKAYQTSVVERFVQPEVTNFPLWG